MIKEKMTKWPIFIRYDPFDSDFFYINIYDKYLDMETELSNLNTTTKDVNISLEFNTTQDNTMYRSTEKLKFGDK